MTENTYSHYIYIIVTIVPLHQVVKKSDGQSFILFFKEIKDKNDQYTVEESFHFLRKDCLSFLKKKKEKKFPQPDNCNMAYRTTHIGCERKNIYILLMPL